jgi:hypothetical protein
LAEAAFGEFAARTLLIASAISFAEAAEIPPEEGQLRQDLRNLIVINSNDRRAMRHHGLHLSH